MRRNVAGQFIGAQMVSATDGSAFTSTVSAFVTVDGGAQGAGAGTVTHEGNGYHGYAPTQGETNGTHVAFTFTGTGAIPATVQVYPTSYDANGRGDTGMFGGTAGTFAAGRPEVNTTHAAGTAWGSGAITAASIADNAIDAGAIAAAALNGKGDWNIGKTGYSLTAGTGLGNQTSDITGTITTAANVTTVNGLAANVITAAATAADFTTEIQSGLATAAALDAVDNFLDTEIAAILALLDDPRPEPGQGAPPVNPDFATKVDYLYKAWRNRHTQDATDYKLYADDATTVDQKAAVSDDGTTFNRGEIATGP